MSRTETLIERIHSVALPVEPPERILIVPWGEVSSRSGPFIVDDAGAASTISAFVDHGVDMLIDYEHQSEGGEFAAPDGLAPAAGWIKRLEAEPGVGLWATVEWTQRAAALIAAKEYRYLSPVMRVRKKNDHLVYIKTVGLTNTPAIDGMRPLVNKEKADEALATEKEYPMKKICAALGLPESADEDAILKAINTKATSSRSALSSVVCKALKLDETAKDEEIVEAINKQAPSAATAPAVQTDGELKLVREALTKTQAELKAMREEAIDNASADRIRLAMSEGRIDEADMADAAKSATIRAKSRDKAEWDGLMALLPCKTPADGRVTRANDRGDAGGGRAGVIRKSVSAFKANPELGRIASLEACVADDLRQAGHSDKLTDEDKKLLIA